ncbi:MAG: sigma-54-dependent transcriptional regulator [Prolixibacteraceae bacterium]
MSDKLNILVVDPDSLYGKLARSILKDDFNVEISQSPFDALEIIRNRHFDILITDYELPGGNGLRLIERCKKIHPEIETIMTGQDTPIKIIDESLALGAIDFFKKPFDYEQVKRSIERTKKFLKINKQLKHTESEREKLTLDLQSKFDGFEIISQSAEMNQVKKLMKMVAQSSDTSVIITGESGVGKELIARGIHQLSERNKKYFGAVNMSAISDSLFESEFFGHKKGSFTGAITDRSGWFEVANEGTLFLDEIGDMPINLQIKMLRVLEDRKYIRVGSQFEQSFDVRIITATNKDIKLLKEGKDFRLDLFHRLGTFEIFIPPLRERKDDIPILLEHFRKLFAAKMRKQITEIEQNTLKMLQRYSYPGNVRELRNIVERAVILCDKNVLNEDHFPNIFESTNELNIPENMFDLEQIEKTVILKALHKVNFNKSKAAELLNLKWNALHRRLVKYNIEVPE